MEATTGPGRPFDVVVVHSLSRLARDLIVVELTTRRLRRAGVQLVSVAQEMADDPNGVLLRRIIATIDEHHSRENARHAHRAMLRNAAEGFWNGARPPSATARAWPRRAGTGPRRCSRWWSPRPRWCGASSDCCSASRGPPWACRRSPRGSTAKGSTTGASRSTSRTCAASSGARPTPAGTIFNRRDWRTGRVRDTAEWVAIDVPPIVPREVFERAQEVLAARNPRTTPPRVVSGPTLLTGLAVCGRCGGGMTRGNGKSGRYGDYMCARRAQRGPCGCGGDRIRLDLLDGLVLDAFAERVLRPERIRALPAAYLDRSEEAEAERRCRLGQLRAELTEAEGRIRRVVQLVASGALEADDPAVRALPGARTTACRAGWPPPGSCPGGAWRRG